MTGNLLPLLLSAAQHAAESMVLLRALTAIVEKLLCRFDAELVFIAQFDGVVDKRTAFLFERPSPRVCLQTARRQAPGLRHHPSGSPLSMHHKESGNLREQICCSLRSIFNSICADALYLDALKYQSKCLRATGAACCR